MLNIPAPSSINPQSGPTRREFLQASALGALGFSLAEMLGARANAAPAQSEKACILIFNHGGPSHLDSWDPKPDAPREIRGPFKAISTKGDFQISEIFPMHAAVADQFSIVRSVHHTAAPVHETGQQMMQTGRLASDGLHTPHAGCVAQFLRGPISELPAHVTLTGSTCPAGGSLSHAHDAGFLGEKYAPFVLSADPSRSDFRFSDTLLPLLIASPLAREAFDLSREPAPIRERYGMNRLGQSCLLARRLVERGVRFVSLDTFVTIFSELTWDIHGCKPFTDIAGMKAIVAPMVDRAYSALIEDLHQRGMLGTTLVANLAEFGRTPKINPAGGRDHWADCWSVYFAGGGVKGGRTIGKSDAIGAYPTESPVQPQEIVATIFQALDLDLEAHLPGPQGRLIPLVDTGTKPIAALF